jgi:hypothetical protein
MDHDDLWEKDKLARQAALLDGDPGIAFVFTQARVERDGSWSRSSPDRRPCRLPGPAYENLVHWNYVPMSSVMARRDRLLALSGDGPFDPRFRLSEDWDLWLRLARAAGPGGVAFVAEPLTRYVILPGRATERMGDLRLEDLVILDEQLRTDPGLVARDPARCPRHAAPPRAGGGILPPQGRTPRGGAALPGSGLARPPPSP